MRFTDEFFALDIRYIRSTHTLEVDWTLHCRAERKGRQGATVDIEVSSSCELTLRYGHKDGTTPLERKVALCWTPCNYGGARPWFVCPEAGCGKRIAILYFQPTIGCRKCHEIGFRSQQQSRELRRLLAANKIRGRLGWPPGIMHGDGPKPKGMHWRTFSRLVREYASLFAIRND